VSDMKDTIQEIADEMAFVQYGKDFYELPDTTQTNVYMRALDEFTNRQADRSDYLRKAAQENAQ
jgi:hypothetical protein